MIERSLAIGVAVRHTEAVPYRFQPTRVEIRDRCDLNAVDSAELPNVCLPLATATDDADPNVSHGVSAHQLDE
jgi:hypothetical protein